MPQHREVSPKDLGLSAEDQELMRLGDVYQDPERPRSVASGREDSDRLDAPGNSASRENDDEADDAEE